MKKEWIRPLTEVQLFVANEYVAACGDENEVYKFKCDAGGGVYGDVYKETNGVSGLQKYPSLITMTRADENLTGIFSSYHACDKTHEASTKDEFVNGYYVVGDEVTPVIIWTEGGTNVHCTTNLDMSTWQTAKS